ncbi:MAG: hypothetical protein KDB80_11450 [Planctomycetes bacterium]|nr:hypothetical protein [Planctomycetota bacterium]
MTTGSGPQDFKRKILLIDKTLQARIIKSIAWPCGIALIIASTLLCMFCFDLVTEAFEANVELPSVTPLMITAGACLIGTLGLVAYNALKISHRVAGPLYRMRAVMDEIRDGKSDARIRIRPADYLQEFADDLNAFLEWSEQQRGKAENVSTSAEPERATVEAAN